MGSCNYNLANMAVGGITFETQQLEQSQQQSPFGLTQTPTTQMPSSAIPPPIAPPTPQLPRIELPTATPTFQSQSMQLQQQPTQQLQTQFNQQQLTCNESMGNILQQQNGMIGTDSGVAMQMQS